MVKDETNTACSWARPPLTTELLLMPDGRILVHNLTPAFADLLHGLNPDDDQIRPRAGQFAHLASPIPHPAS
jgi:hypothetical protein